MISPVKGNEFKRWALRGCRIYGDDQWFFLRELAQNARDAGATAVTVDAWREGDDELVRFTDNGSGMAEEHAQRYLFRLYASSKEEQHGFAGQYGIGFWAVLRFEPDRLTIASNGGRGPWAVAIDREFQLAKIAAPELPRGTCVTLRRRARFPSQAELVAEVEAALTRFCRYLRRNDRQASPLPVRFRDQEILQPMTLPGPLWLHFKNRANEGVVGLAPRPAVELFARGLPVWKGMLLDELSYGGTDHPWRGEIAQGLAPVFVLNGNRLNVVMSRNAVVDDRALGALRRQAAAALEELVEDQLNRTLPPGLWHRLMERLRRGLGRVGRIPLIAFLPVVAVLALASALWVAAPRLREWAGGRPSPVADTGPEVAEAPPALPAPEAPESRLPTVYQGSVVDQLPSTSTLELIYAPEELLYFKLLTAESFDRHRGFVARRTNLRPHPFVALPCRDDGRTEVTLVLNESGQVALPVPSGHALVEGSLQVDQRPQPLAGQSDTGEPLVALTGPALLTYLTCATRGGDVPSPVTEVKAFSALGAKVQAARRKWSREPVPQQLEWVLSLVRQRVVYDDSPAAAEQYLGLVADADWLEFVLRTGRGDCDVMNALAVLLLRELGIPARLAIGHVGRGGRLVPGLHAWVEYYHHGWHVADASSGAAAPVPGADADVADGAALEAPDHGKPTSSPAPPTGAPATPAGRTPLGPARPVAVAPEAAAAPAPTLSDGPAPPVWMGLAGALVVMALLVAGLRRRRQGRELVAELDPERAETILGDMALSAASQPGAWTHAEALWRHPILPLLARGRRLSLRRAQREALRGRLFSGGRGDSAGFAVAVAQAGTPVVNAGHRVFGRLAGQLPGIVDLDHVEALSPQIEPALDPQELVGATNALLRRVLLGRVALVACPGLAERALLDVDLRRARLPRPWRAFRRFVALAVDEEYKGLSARFVQDPHGAIFALVDRVSRESRYYRRHGQDLRARAAAILLRREAP